MHPSIIVPKRRGIALAARAVTHDAMTFDAAAFQPFNARGDARGVKLEHSYRYRTHDGRSITVDSTGAFLVGELERLDQTLHLPLADVSFARDIDFRNDVSIGDEVSSFTQSSFGSTGSTGSGQGGTNGAARNGKAWIGKATDQIAGVSLDIAKVPQPLRPWAIELKFSILELESAARVGRSVEDQKYEAMKMKNQMDTDEQVYVGDASTGDTGLLNAATVTNVSNVPNGALGSSTWVTKTPDEILADVNAILVSAWTQSGFAVMPDRLLLPPSQFGYISTQKVSSAGNMSILKYLLENNILTTSGQGTLKIFPAKWLVGAGVGGTIGTAGTVDRMVAYTKEQRFIRFPKTMLSRTPVQYDSIYHKTTYYCRLGVVEVVYPETIAYRDGI